MEADWEVEIGGDAPVIDGAWPGRVALEGYPGRIALISEIRQLPALADVLLRINHPDTSPVWSSKCDLWSVDAFDPDELDAPQDASQTAMACYIDLLPYSSKQWNS